MSDPLREEAVCRRARALLDLGRVGEALVEAKRALALDPGNREALEIEGLCHLRSGAAADALAALGRALARAPDAAHVHYLYGFALRELGQPREALAPFASALRLAPEEPVYLRALAELHSDLGSHAEALPLAQRAAEMAPNRAANHVTWGYVASAAGDKELARREYERAVTLDPTDAAAWNNLGCLDLEARRPLRARARFREALRLDPRADRARRNLELVRAPGGPRSAGSWDGVVEALAAELVRGRAPLTLLGALVLEAPAAARALVRGGDRGAALSGAALAVALRAMGRAAWLPLAVGAAAGGAVYLAGRRSIAAARARVRAELDAGRAEFAELFQAWLDGRVPRRARDAAIEALVERMAIALAGEA